MKKSRFLLEPLADSRRAAGPVQRAIGLVETRWSRPTWRWSASRSLTVWVTVCQPAKKPGETGRLGLKPGYRADSPACRRGSAPPSVDGRYACPGELQVPCPGCADPGRRPRPPAALAHRSAGMKCDQRVERRAERGVGRAIAERHLHGPGAFESAWRRRAGRANAVPLPVSSRAPVRPSTATTRPPCPVLSKFSSSWFPPAGMWPASNDAAAPAPARAPSSPP